MSITNFTGMVHTELVNETNKKIVKCCEKFSEGGLALQMALNYFNLIF